MKHSDYDSFKGSPDRMGKIKPNKPIHLSFEPQTAFQEPESKNEFKLFGHSDAEDDSSQFFFSSFKRYAEIQNLKIKSKMSI